MLVGPGKVVIFSAPNKYHYSGVKNEYLKNAGMYT